MPRVEQSLTDIVRRAAVSTLGESVVQGISLKEDEGFLSEEILRVRIVLPPDGVRSIDGDKLFDALDSISKAVQRAGENRRIVLEYADIAELEERGTHQS